LCEGRLVLGYRPSHLRAAYALLANYLHHRKVFESS
jgi:hypothetical protein